MIAELLRDMKEDLRELPGVAVAVTLAVMVGLGCNAEIFWHADGDGLRVSASREQSTTDQVERLHAMSCTAELTPGFTVLLGLRQYSVEVSVPIPVVRSLSDEVRANVAVWCDRRQESVA